MAADVAVSGHVKDVRSDPLFVRSLNPIFVADDQRRFVDANAAACLFLRQPVDRIRQLRIDDVTTPDVRPGLDAMWSEFLNGTLATRTTPWKLQMPDGPSIPVDLSSTPNYRPGLHLAIVLFPAETALNDRLDRAALPSTSVLTKREREILSLVALGNTGVEIARQLFLSPATVQTHVANALIKLGAKNRAHGITLALQANELDLTLTAGGLHPPLPRDPWTTPTRPTPLNQTTPRRPALDDDATAARRIPHARPSGSDRPTWKTPPQDGDTKRGLAPSFDTGNAPRRRHGIDLNEERQRG